MNVLSIDPGKTTGWAQWPPWTAGENDNWYETAQALQHRIRDFDLIVCETFRITVETGKKSQQHWSLEMIGVIKLACWQSGTPLVMQSPGDAMSFATNDKLRKAGMYSVGMEHARDASRHLLLYLVRNSQETGFDSATLL